jgi:hypothetical protein
MAEHPLAGLSSTTVPEAYEREMMQRLRRGESTFDILGLPS